MAGTKINPAGASHPVQALEQQKQALAAAVLLASNDPAKEHVHRIRTTTRRMEAQLELLATLDGAASGAAPPPYRKTARRLGKLLKKVRRAGGAVRDLDVQRKSLEELGGADGLRKDAARLDHYLKRKRRAAADDLLRTLAKLEGKLVRSLDELSDALEPRDDFSLPAAEVEQRIRGWYRERAAGAGDRQSTGQLHEVRKVAKLARYMGEANGSDALAGQFEALQQAGGTWHDFLMLAEIARERLGGGSSLARLLGERRDEARRDYLERLGRFAA